ncbi:hypothetical protein [Pseudomonas sp.]
MRKPWPALTSPAAGRASELPGSLIIFAASLLLIAYRDEDRLAFDRA